MASTSGLQNNPTNNLNTIDGLQIINATSIFDNGVLIDPTAFVPYNGATSDTNLGTYKISSSAAPTTNNNLTNKLYVDGAVSTGSGDTLGIVNLNFVRYTGSISDTDLGTYKISSSTAPSTSYNLTNKNYVDTQDALRVPYTGATSNTDLGTYKISSSTAPSTSYNLTNKTYVDTQDALRVPYTGATSNVVLTGTNNFQQAYNALTSDTTTLVNRQTLDSAISGLGAGILNLNNTWTGTNTFNNNITTGDGYTNNFGDVVYTGVNAITSGTPTTTGITAAAPTPSGTISFSSPTYTMTPSGSLTFACFWSSATFVASQRYFFTFTNATTTVYAPSATLTVCQSNAANTGYVAISSSYSLPSTATLFSGYFIVNLNASYTGQIFFILSNVKFTPFTWTAFTFSSGALTVQGNQITTGNTTINGDVFMSILKNLYIYYISSTNNAGWVSNSSGDLSLFTGTSGTVNRITVLAGGNIGIGSGSSLNPLQVYKNTPIPSITTSGYMDSQLALQSNSAILKIGQYYTGGTGAPAYIQSSDYYSSVEHPQPIILNPLGGSVCIGTKVVGAYTRPVGNSFARFTINSDYSDAATGFGINASDGTSDDYTMKLYPYVVAGGVVGYAFGTLNNATNYIPLSFNRNFVGVNQTSPSYNLDVAGNMRVKNADDSMTYYGANATWSSYLVVGSGTEKSGASTAHVISTNGNLHLDAGNGNAIYYGYYANSHGTPNPHYFYGTDIEFSSGIPFQNAGYCYPVCLQGTRLYYSQCMFRQMYANNGIGWGGGINLTYAFYKNSASVNVKISGKCSYYVSGATMAYPYLRLYSQNSGLYYSYSFQAFTNNGSNHSTFPFEIVLTASNIPYAGWWDVYFYNAGNCNTDTNDQLWINVEVLPMSDF